AWVKRAVVGRSASVMEVSEFIASSQSLSPHHHIDDPGGGMISTGANCGFRGHTRAARLVPAVNRRKKLALNWCARKRTGLLTSLAIISIVDPRVHMSIARV
ncbi:MAG TPA: hypothetical protein VGI36_18655, partial [Candidatus Binataceae bacterium]